MPRSYTDLVIIDRHLDLQDMSPGSVTSLRELSRSLAMSPSALYRYFPSIGELEDAGTPRLVERLVDASGSLSGDAGSRLSALVREHPGLMWATCRLDVDRLAPEPEFSSALVGPTHPDPIVRSAILGVVGVLWRLNPTVEGWAAAIDRVVAGAASLFEAALGIPLTSGVPDHRLRVRLGDVVSDATRLDPAAVAVITGVDRDGNVPSSREIAQIAGAPRASLFRDKSITAVAGDVRAAMFEQLRPMANAPYAPTTPVELVLANWLPAVDMCFDRPAIVDVIVAAPIEANPHRDHQRAVWAEVRASDAFATLTDDDLTDLLAGFIMFAARRRAVSRADATCFVERLVRAVVPMPP